MSFLKKGSPVEDLFSPAQEYDQLLPLSKKNLRQDWSLRQLKKDAEDENGKY